MSIPVNRAGAIDTLRSFLTSMNGFCRDHGIGALHAKFDAEGRMTAFESDIPFPRGGPIRMDYALHSFRNATGFWCHRLVDTGDAPMTPEEASRRVVEDLGGVLRAVTDGGLRELSLRIGNGPLPEIEIGQGGPRQAWEMPSRRTEVAPEPF